MKIIPAILEKDFSEVERKYSLVSDACDLVQIDLADGIFVDNYTFLDFYEIERLKGKASIELHLMTSAIFPFLDKAIKNVSSVCAHVESLDFDDSILGQLWVLGYKVGICVNPTTPIEDLYDFIEKADYVQFLTVDPGKQGGVFLENVLEKIKAFKNEYPDIKVQVDGGVNRENISKLLNLGVDSVVIGSAIFEKEDPLKEIASLITAYGNK